MTRSRSISPLMALFVTLTLLTSVLALEFAPGSDCAAYCLDDSDGDASDPDAGTTNSTDIVCTDKEFGSKSKGIKFKNCQECLAKSDYKNGTQTDLHWFLYNMRYTLSTCLFGKPAGGEIKETPCIIDFGCGDFESSFTHDLASPKSNDPPSSDGTFEYCEKAKYPFTNTHWRLDACIQCLHTEESQSYLGNFVAALNAGCEQKPKAGDKLGLTGTVFRSEIINGTEAEENIMDRPAGAGSSTLTTGAIVGIAVGAGLLLFGGLALFCVYWRKQKKYEKGEKEGGDFFPGDHGTYTPDPFLPPQATQMTSSLKHMSGDGGSGFGGAGGHPGKGPVVREAEYETGNYNFDPRSTNRAPNGALPSHPAYIPSAMSRHTERGTPTPPPATHQRNGKSVDVQSIPMHTYNTSTSSSLRGSSEERSGSQQSSHLPPPPPGPPPPAGSSHKAKVPSIGLPAGKGRGPRKYSPPFLNGRGTPSPEQDQPAGVSISQPVMGNEERFHDRPLQGGQVYATDAVPASERTRGQYAEVPMKSGKSALYGY